MPVHLGMAMVFQDAEQARPGGNRETERSFGSLVARPGSRISALAVALLLGASATAAPCGVHGPDKVMLVTADCEDPDYNARTLVIDSETQVDAPVPHTRVLAHFPAVGETNQLAVGFWFPAKDRFDGRFFQETYPLGGRGLRMTPDAEAFANGGFSVRVDGQPNGKGGYRPGAAAAKIAKAYAAKLYGWNKPIYGYITGLSGGAIQTVGMMENTTGVWQGGVPRHLATETGRLYLSDSTTRLAQIAFGADWPRIGQKVLPGTGGDLLAGLSPDKRAVLKEYLSMGYPVRAYDSILETRVLDRPDNVAGAKSPAYVSDFWSKPGYEGTNPPPFLAAAKFDRSYTVTGTNPDGSLVLNAAPDFATASTTGASGIDYWVYDAGGARLPGSLVGTLTGNTLRPGAPLVTAERGQFAGEAPSAARVTQTNAPLIKALQNGGKLRVNNLTYLAVGFYQRHALPLPVTEDTAQYRDAAGKPLYPQQPDAVPSASVLGGARMTGRPNGKIIVLVGLLDEQAFPVQADNYSKRIRATMGQKWWEDNFRIYFNDHAQHTGGGGPSSRILPEPSYPSFRDLYLWVERGIAPPPSTRYEMVDDAQIRLPDGAAERGGEQPVVTLQADGGKTAFVHAEQLTFSVGESVEVAAGRPVTFHARIETPPAAKSRIVKVEWSFEAPANGENTAWTTTPAPSEPSLNLTDTHVFSTPGTYYPAVRVSALAGNGPDLAATVPGLGRMRVVVK